MFWFKRVLPWFKKFEIKYCFKGFDERNNFLHRNLSRFEMDFKIKKTGNPMSDLGSSKLNKIARDGLKI